MKKTNFSTTFEFTAFSFVSSMNSQHFYMISLAVDCFSPIKTATDPRKKY